MSKIKALILCAGYGTRLYPLTEDKPKALLEVGDKAILGHLLEKIETIKNIEQVYIVTNHRFYEHFRIWLNHNHFKKNIKIINDGTLSNDQRLGAIGDLRFTIKEEDINDDLLVIAGDNLFGFSLQKFIDSFTKKEASHVAFHDLKDIEKVRRRLGVGVLEKTKLVHFEEKPWEPKSTLAATACYIFKKNDLKHIESLLAQGKVDATGDLIKWLVDKSEVHGYVFDEHWYDIGSHEALKEAEEAYR